MTRQPGLHSGAGENQGGPWTLPVSPWGSIYTDIAPLGRAPESPCRKQDPAQPGTLAGAATVPASECGSPPPSSSCSAICHAGSGEFWGNLLEKRNGPGRSHSRDAHLGDFLVVQWLRISLPIQRIQVRPGRSHVPGGNQTCLQQLLKPVF